MIALGVRSHYSLMRGTASPGDLAQAAKARGWTGIALTDTDNLYGLWAFLRECQYEGVTPVIGVEIGDPASDRKVIAIVRDSTGWPSLCSLLTARHRAPEFRLEKAVAVHGADLILLGRDAAMLQAWKDAGLDVAAFMGHKPDGAANHLRRWAHSAGIPCIMGADSWMLDAEDHASHRVIRAIALNTTLGRLKQSDIAPADAWLVDADTLAHRFAIWPDVMDDTRALESRIAFHGPDRSLVFPGWCDPSGEEPGTVLRREAMAGAVWRYGDPVPANVVQRLDYELGLIESKGFSSYFLVVRDIVRRSPRICGRGSGAASLVAYCLGITNVCPVKHNLYFERFLNPGRVDPPDIDVDFAWDERDGVIDSVLSQYAGCSAMVCNHVRLQPRMAIRETAKVYGIPEREIARVTQRLPWFWHVEDAEADLEEQIKSMPQMRGIELPDPWPEMLAIAQRISGTPRNLSVHPGGIVITPDALDHHAPIETAPKGVPIIQWEKDGAEEAGLVKIDLLGNRSLGVIRDAIANLLANGITVGENGWNPEDDPATQQSVAEGRTQGCFYIESPAMRLLQKKAGTGDFEHLVLLSSIIRPASNIYIQEYLRRLHGGEWQPLHPLLKDTLAETLGIMVYQEDVSRCAVALAGFSHAEADGLRKIMSKKDKGRQLADYHKRFVEGCHANGVSDETVNAVWAMMLSFDGYSFCKPHSASYAKVSYQSAWLKTHHPAEFMAAVISNQGGFYSTFAYVSEAQRLGLVIEPPDVNRSAMRWRGNARSILVGLQSVKGLSEATANRILANRPFASAEAFLEIVRPDSEEGRNLIHSGALDGFGLSRAHLLWKQAVHQSGRAVGGSLYERPQPQAMPDFPSEDRLERLRLQFAALGFLPDRHPMTFYEESRRQARTIMACDIQRHIGKRVHFMGWLITGKVVTTKKQEPMEFLTFEDETGLVETTFFPDAYARFCHMLDRNRPYLLTGLVEENWGAVTLTVEKCGPPEVR